VKIAYFAEIFPSISETWVHHEISQLIDMGCDVRVFATHARPTIIAPELSKFAALTTYLPEVEKSIVDVLRVFCSSAIRRNVLAAVITDCPRNRQRLQVIRDIAIAGLFARQLTAYRPQFILAHFGGTRANLALIWSMVSGTPFGIKFHAADVFERVALLRLKVKRAAKLMTISRFNLSFMCEHYPDVDFTGCSIHKCGIPVDEYQFHPKSIYSDSLVIMSTGRLVPMKGFPVLLHASKRLLEKGLSHKLKIYGDGPERKRLVQLTKAMGLEATVEIMGHYNPSGIRAALLGADIFVLPAVFDRVERTMDGIPVSLMEAMAIGTPVVSTRISGIPELIEHGVNGYLAVPGDSVSLAEAILRWQGLNERDRSQMLAAARTKIELDHDAQKLSSVLKGDLVGLRMDGSGKRCAQ